MYRKILSTLTTIFNLKNNEYFYIILNIIPTAVLQDSFVRDKLNTRFAAS